MKVLRIATLLVALFPFVPLWAADPESATLAEPLKALEREIGQWEVLRKVPTNGFVGIGFVNFPQSRASRRYSYREGVLVVDVRDDGPAIAAGLQKDDVIFELNGTPVEGVDDWQARMAGTRPGEKVKLKIARRKTMMEINVTLSSYPGRTAGHVRTIAGASGNSLVTERPFGTEMTYFDPIEQKIVRVTVTTTGAISRIQYLAEELGMSEYSAEAEVTFPDGKAGSHVEHTTWDGPDRYSVWLTDRFRDSEKLPDSEPVTYRRVKE